MQNDCIKLLDSILDAIKPNDILTTTKKKKKKVWKNLILQTTYHDPSYIRISTTNNAMVQITQLI